MVRRAWQARYMGVHGAPAFERAAASCMLWCGRDCIVSDPVDCGERDESSVNGSMSWSGRSTNLAGPANPWGGERALRGSGDEATSRARRIDARPGANGVLSRMLAASCLRSSPQCRLTRRRGVRRNAGRHSGGADVICGNAAPRHRPSSLEHGAAIEGLALL